MSAEICNQFDIPESKLVMSELVNTPLNESIENCSKEKV